MFVTLYKEGLIYKDKRLVNWDPKLLTAISDLEVEQQEVDGNLWHFRYPLEGETFDPETRRPSSPSPRRGPRRCSAIPALRFIPTTSASGIWSASTSCLPLVGRRIPVVADEYSDPEKGYRRGQDHAGARLQRFRGRQAPSAAGDQHHDRRGAIDLKDNEDFLAGLNRRPSSRRRWRRCTAWTASRRASWSSR